MTGSLKVGYDVSYWALLSCHGAKGHHQQGTICGELMKVSSNQKYHPQPVWWPLSEPDVKFPQYSHSLRQHRQAK